MTSVLRPMMEWYWQGKIEVPGQTPVPVPLCPRHPIWIILGWNPGLHAEGTGSVTRGRVHIVVLSNGKTICYPWKRRGIFSSRNVVTVFSNTAFRSRKSKFFLLCINVPPVNFKIIVRFTHKACLWVLCVSRSRQRSCPSLTKLTYVNCSAFRSSCSLSHAVFVQRVAQLSVKCIWHQGFILTSTYTWSIRCRCYTSELHVVMIDISASV
jgi:hypothetical protein